MKRLLILLVLIGLVGVGPVYAQSAKTHTFHDAAGATGNGTSLSVSGWATVGVQVVISATATVTFEATSDDSNWVSAICASSATPGLTTSTATASGLYQCNISGYTQFRARISSFGSGTVTVKGLLTLASSGKGGSGLPQIGSEGDCLLTQSGLWSSGACPGAGTGAPTTAQYWVGAADATLTAEKDLGSLGTGMVINTAGTPSIYAGASCTNQVIRVLNASGAATCNTITSAFVDTTVWTGTASSGILKASSQGVLTAATVNTDYVSPASAANWGDGVRQTFNPNGTNAGLNVGSHTTDPISLSNGDIFYDSVAGKFRCQEGGVTKDCIGAAASAAFTDITTGTNSTATMTVGTGATLTTSGSGTIVATTSAALAANGANCSAGEFPLGVDTAGAVESCTAVSSVAVTSVDATGGVQTSSGSAITATGTIRGAHVANAQTGTTYTFLTGDRGKFVTFSNGSSIAVTLPQAGAGFEDGWFVIAKNIGAGTVTITPTTSTINGGADVTLTTGKSLIIASDGTNYTSTQQSLLAEADTLDTVFDRGKVVDGANSVANAVRIGDGTTPWCIYTDATAGPTMKPCTDSDTRTNILTNFNWSLYDVEGDASILTVNPDAASMDLVYVFGSNYKPRKSIWFDAGAASVDGTQCATPTESANTLVKTWTIVCADNDAGAIYWKVAMPDSWDGGTVTAELQVHQVGASTNGIELDIAAMCYSHDEAISAFASPPTGEQAAAITLTADNDVLHATTSAITVAGTTCAGGDTLFLTAQVDATASHADLATAVEILGVKMEYSTSSLSD